MIWITRRQHRVIGSQRSAVSSGHNGKQRKGSSDGVNGLDGFTDAHGPAIFTLGLRRGVRRMRSCSAPAGLPPLPARVRHRPMNCSTLDGVSSRSPVDCRFCIAATYGHWSVGKGMMSRHPHVSPHARARSTQLLSHVDSQQYGSTVHTQS